MTITNADTSDAEAIREITNLAHQARGVTIETISPPPGSIGLPEQIPVAVRHGITPELVGIRPLVDQWRTKPERKRGTATALTLNSFIGLANRHKTSDSVIFADTNWRVPSLTAIIDYHPIPGGADNNAHRIVYKFPLSEQWQEWVKMNGVAMSQGDFAAFIEDRIADLATASDDHRRDLEATFGTRVATPAELMQLSRGLTINVDSAIRNVQNLQTGETQIAFDEAHKDASGKPIRVPGMFVIRTAPFFMGESVMIPVRLRYRVKDGKIVWFFQIYRPDMHVTERVRADLDVASAATGLPAFEGAPEA